MIKDIYGCSAITELSVDSNGYGFLVIFGRHINGYYIAIPNHNICVEAADANDTFYNKERLLSAGLGEKEAADITAAISAVVSEMELNRKEEVSR